MKQDPFSAFDEVNDRLISLTNGGNTIISKDDLPLVSTRSWYQVNGYALTGHGDIKLHNLLMNHWDYSTHEVHHKNDNRLDNRRWNLVVLSFREHLVTRPKQSNNQSGYKGVSWKNPKGNRKGHWVAQTSYQKQKVFLGYHNTAEEAALAYDRFMIRTYGELACVNFPIK